MDLIFRFLAVKLANDCCRYGNEQHGGETSLSKVAVQFGNSHILMEKEKGDLNTFLGSQVIIHSAVFTSDMKGTHIILSSDKN